MTSAIHPDVRALLAVSRAAGTRPFEAMGVGDARLAYAGRRSLQLPPDEVAETRDLSIPGPRGAIPLRLYRALGANGDGDLPCLLFMHGGGWVLGDLDSHDGVCRRLANEARCCVVAVDYRLAPEHPFPAAIEDSAAALRFVHAGARDLGVDPARIAVGGDSAGGNLAAALALMGRDGIVPPSTGQVLLYPALDLAVPEEGYGPPTDGMTLTPATMRWFVDHYLPEPAARADWRAAHDA